MEQVLQVLQICRTCKHAVMWGRTIDGFDGICKHGPPTPIIMTLGAVISLYPQIGEDWSCGQHAVKDDE